MDRNQTFDRVLRLEPGRAALLVIDMQRGFLDPGEAMEVPPAREIIPRIQALLTLFREKRLPVIFTEYAYSQAVPLLVGELHPEHKRALPGNPRGFGRPSSSCLEGEDNAHTVSDLAPRPGQPGVRQRRVGAFTREYRVVVVEDAVAPLWPEIQRATLDIFRRAFARVVSAKEVADELALW